MRIKSQNVDEIDNIRKYKHIPVLCALLRGLSEAL